MKILSDSTSRQRRPRLLVAIPAIAAAASAIMLAVLFAILIPLSEHQARLESQRQAEVLARLVAPPMARGDTEEAARILETSAPQDAALFDADGALVTGRKALSDQAGIRKIELADAGERSLGHLVAARLVPARYAPTLVQMTVFSLAAIAFSALVGALFARQIVNALRNIENQLRGRAGPDDARQAPGFAEIHKTALEVQRTVANNARARLRLDRLAHTDPVTGLPNQNALQAAMDRALKTSDFSSPICFMLLEIDHYHRAIELVGHGGARTVRLHVIQRIGEELQQLEKLGRIEPGSAVLSEIRPGELGLLLSDIMGRQEASAIARALRRALVAPLEIDGRKVTLGLSGGIVLAPEDGGRSDELMSRATVALRTLAADARYGFTFYTPQLDHVAKGRLQLETEIRAALSKGEFMPHFQPKIEFETGRVAGCEALARWQRSGRRDVSPGAFIPVAEETGLIDEIGRQILNQSCAAGARWTREGLAVTVAVNVSPNQLKTEAFRSEVLDAITRTGLSPSCLELEITESTAISDPVQFEQVMKPLQAMGVRLAIDDFGTGHSNLSILSRLSFDVFKIDRQYIAELQKNDVSAPIVEMILAMAESLGLDTVAEGIETPQQAEFLKRRGCTHGQGFLYSPALPHEQFKAFVRDWESRRRAA